MTTVGQEREEEIDLALQPFGYYRPSVHSRLTGGKNGQWLAEYQVDPGPAIRLDSVDVQVRGEGAGLPGFRRLVERFPLKKGDVDVQLDVQAVFTTVYDRAGYQYQTDYKVSPEAPLDEARSAWADALLRSKGLRS